MVPYVPGAGIGQRLLKWRYLNWWGRLDALAQFLSQLGAMFFVITGIGNLLLAAGAGHPTHSGRSTLQLITLISAGVFMLGLLLRMTARVVAGGGSQAELGKPLAGRPPPASRVMPDPGGKLVLKRRLARRAAFLWGSLYLGILFVCLPGLLMLAEPSTGVKTAGAVVLVLFVSLELWLYRSGQRRAKHKFDQFPVIEATADELRMTDPDGSVTTVRRGALKRVIQLQAQEIKGTRIQFRDARGHELAHWDLNDRVLKNVVIRWIRHLGYGVELLQGTEALQAARSHKSA